MRRLLTILVLCASLRAESWDDLKGLKAGDPIKVQDTKGSEVKGAFRAVSDDGITLATSKNEVSIERARVRRVQIRSDSRRARNAAIGAGIGVALGVAIDQTLGAFFRNEGGQSGAARAASYVVPIGVLAGLGGAFPAYRTVYKTK